MMINKSSVVMLLDFFLLYIKGRITGVQGFHSHSAACSLFIYVTIIMLSYVIILKCY